MANTNNTYDFLEVKFLELKQNVSSWIKELYNKSDINLNQASPYGHILDAITKLHESDLLYLKNIVSQFDINNPNNNNVKMVKALARIGGLNPSRAISASGTITLQLRSGIELDEIGNASITIVNGTKLTNNTNSLDYFIDLGGKEYSTFKVEKNKKIILPCVQGKLEKQSFTGSGNKLQSFSVVLPNSQQVEQYRIVVKVNGQVWTRVENLGDMLPNEKNWYSKAGIDSGLDIYFGTGDFGAIPSIGSLIEVEYVISNGSLGNIFSNLVDDFEFVDDVYDGFGASIDVASNFMIFIDDEISLGADQESVQFTKAMMPYTSRNFVLARPEQYIFLLKRLNQFSQIDAFTTERDTVYDNADSNDDSVVYLFLIPNISLFVVGNNSYFDLDINAFYLEDSEKNKIETWLRTQGIMSLGTAVKILDPIITKYVINLHLVLFEQANEDNVRSSVLDVISNYVANIERRGRIDKSGIIRELEVVDGIDSITIDFISENNEKYHLDFENYKKSILKDNPKQDPSKIIMAGYEPNKTLGLDPKLGDIVYTKNELPIIRGGFTTREGIYFNEKPQTNGLGCVNIIIEGYSKRKLF